MTPTETRPIKGVAIPRRRVWWMALGAVAALVAIGMFGARIFENDGLSITVTNVRQITHSPMLEIEPELSPDGRELLYTAGYPGAFHLHVRSVEGGPALVLTEGLPGNQGIAEWHPSGASVEFANDLRRLTPQFYRVSKFGGRSIVSPEPRWPYGSFPLRRMAFSCLPTDPVWYMSSGTSPIT